EDLPVAFAEDQVGAVEEGVGVATAVVHDPVGELVDTEELLHQVGVATDAFGRLVVSVLDERARNGGPVGGGVDADRTGRGNGALARRAQRGVDADAGPATRVGLRHV